LSRLHEPVTADTLYVTGDDGTVDWVRNVLPWCQQRGIPTHTGVITGVWRERPIYPVTHRVQIALSLPDKPVPQPILTDEQREYIDRVYRYETDPRRRYLKGACNLVMDFEQADATLGRADFDELRLLTGRFARPDEYRFPLAEVGVHTVSHRAFGGDPETYLADEIIPCLTALLQHGLNVTGFFTLPMWPMFGATVEQLIEPLQRYGFAGILDGAGEWDGRSFIVPRIDAKNVEQTLGLPAWEGE
jgi:hypothetical protein